jgi:hypothetical protein
MREIEPLCAHLCANAPAIDVKYQPAVRGVCQVEVPHVLESALVNGATAWR